MPLECTACEVRFLYSNNNICILILSKLFISQNEFWKACITLWFAYQILIHVTKNADFSVGENALVKFGILIQIVNVWIYQNMNNAIENSHHNKTF